MGTVKCPRCRGTLVRRSGRRSLSERLLSLAYVYPFRCEQCQHRFSRFRWNEHYVRAVADRREHERLPIQAWSTLWADGGPREARVVDLSIAGCSLEAAAPLPEGEVVQLTLQPGGEEPGIVVDEAVVRSSRDGRLGLQFIRVKEDQEGRLRRYLYEVSISRLS
jgi:PilZ domain